MKHLFKITSLLLLASCAQIVAPGGGPKDKDAPQVLKYKPDSASTNFKSKSIEILFDEYIVLRDLNSQLIISPPLENIPDTKVKGKTLFIDFDPNEPLLPNTTYSFNFGNAIIDLNESNSKEDFKYIFSTGSYIDSLTVSGKVQNAFDHKTEKNNLVMLYNDNSDSVVFKNLPSYFSKTKEDGTFTISNIREGEYKIIALKDENNNYKFDPEKEKIAFIENPITVLKEKEIYLELFQEPVQKLFVKKRVHSSFGKILFVFNRPTDTINIIPLNHTFKEEEVIIDYSLNKDSLTYWFNNNPLNDSLILQVLNGSEPLDTLEFNLTSKEKSMNNNRNPFTFSLLKSPAGNKNLDLNADISLLFNNPIDSINENLKIELLEDSLAFESLQPLSFRFSNTNQRALNLGFSTPCGDSIMDIKNQNTTIFSPCWTSKLKFKENTNYQLLILPGTFTDIFGLKNDSIQIDFKTRENMFYGTIQLKVSPPSDSVNSDQKEQNYIVQLLDQKENIVRENKIKGGEILNYTYLHPKEYILKLIIDENNNGKWDTGNYLEKRKAEKVIYFDKPVKIRSNWDLDLEWILQD